MSPTALLAMVSVAETLLILMFLATGLAVVGVVGVVVFLAIRSSSNSSQLQRRVDELERQVQELRKPPRV